MLVPAATRSPGPQLRSLTAVPCATALAQITPEMTCRLMAAYISAFFC
jgi:hypothetical protein